jgi:RimJ/RimL family protein N-acetyltransferase
MKMIIKGKGFILRHIRLSDLEGYYECYQGKNIKQALLRIPKNLNVARKGLISKIKDLKKKRPFGETFAIEVDGEFAGYIEIHHLNLEYHEHKGEIGYAVHPKYRGRGLASKSVRLLTQYAFKKYKLRRISAMGRVNNKASSRVLEKAGYKLEGILRKNKCVDGKYLDDFIYAKVR